METKGRADFTSTFEPRVLHQRDKENAGGARGSLFHGTTQKTTALMSLNSRFNGKFLLV